MIKLENTEVFGWEATIRGMRNPKNSWGKSDSNFFNNYDDGCKDFILGGNDKKLALTLAEAGPVHGKFLRMIHVQVDITAPLYWWKEADTYKVGTTANSCSTMHKIHTKEFTLDDFSHEHLCKVENEYGFWCDYKEELKRTIDSLNFARELFLKTKDKKYWWQMIQTLPTNYNQKRTWDASYETLANIYEYRRNHKLDEWHVFCDWIESLPHSELITCRVNSEEKQ